MKTKTKINAQTAYFLDLLVQAVFGFKIAQIPTQHQAKAIKISVDLYANFIANYLKKEFGAKESMRFKSSLQYPDTNIFQRFADYGVKFDQAYKAFLQFLATTV
jgi:hypothetical protein